MLVSDVEASRALILALAGMGIVFVLIGIWLAVFVHRSFAQRPSLTSRFREGTRMACPGCGGSMEEGYVMPAGGLHWRGGDEPTGMPTLMGGLPGSVGWTGRPRLHAFRCQPCQIVTLRYGRHGGPALQ